MAGPQRGARRQAGVVGQARPAWRRKSQGTKLALAGRPGAWRRARGDGEATPTAPSPPLQGVAVKNAGVRMPGPAAVSCATWGIPLHLSVSGSSSTKWNS